MGFREWAFQHWFQQKQRRMMAPAFSNALAARIAADTDSFRVAGGGNWLVNTSDPRSFSYWIKSNDGTWKASAMHLCVANNSAGAGSRFNSFMFGTRDSVSTGWVGRIPTTADSATQDWIWTAPTATIGVWYHVLVVVDFTQAQANRMRLYVNGVLQSTGSAGSTATAFLSSSQPFAVGSNSSGAATRTQNDSSIDELAVYNTALGAADALEHYNGGVSRDLRALASASGLMSYWRFGDVAGDLVSAVQDLVGGRTLVGFGSPAFEGGVP